MKTFNEKEYMKKYHKEYFKKNKERIYANYRNYSKRKRLELISLLGGKCVRCGESDWRCLQVDHINGNGKIDRRKRAGSKAWTVYLIEKIKNGSKDYQLLCANCNWKKKYENDEN
jgi:hypothetical protein